MSLAQSRSTADDIADLKARIAELTTRLEEAEDTLRAIRDGDVDAIVVGSDVYTLDTAGAASNRFRGEMLAQVSDAVIATDPEERITFLNAAAERQYGVSASDVLGRGFADIYTRHWTAPDAEAGMWTALRERGEWRGELIHRRHDGRELHVEKVITALRGPDGVTTGMVATIRDITERKRADRALRVSEERMRRAEQAARSGTWDWDFQSGEASWSEAAWEVFGRTSGESTVTFDSWLTCVHPEDRQAAVAGIEAARGVGLYRDEYRVLDPDRTVRWVESRGEVIFDAIGQPVRMLGTVQDITARKRRERNHVFLVDMQNVFAPLTSATEIIRAVGERLAEHLRLIHCTLVEVDELADACTVLHDHNAPGTRNLAGDYRLSDFHPEEERRVLASGAPLVIANVRDDGRAALRAELFEALEIRALVNAGYVSGGRLRFVLHASRAEPYAWPAEEVSLLTEMAERVYVRVERARAETVLRDSEEFNRTVLESSPDCLKVIAADGTVLSLNDNGCSLLRLSDPTVMVGKKWWSFWPEESRALVQDAVVRASRGETVRFEREGPIATGEMKWWDVEVSPVRNPDGSVSRIVAVSRDVTERKQAEEKIRVSGERLNLLHEITSNPTLGDAVRSQSLLRLGCEQFDLENGVVGEVTGDIYQVALAISPGDSIPIGFSCPVKDALCDEVLRRNDLLAVENIGGGEWRGHRAHSVFGTEVYFGVPINVDGRVFGTLCFTSPKPRETAFTRGDEEFLRLLANTLGAEMTRQHFTEQLRQSEERLRRIFKQSPAGIVQTDALGNMTVVNDRWCEMLGFSRAELLGRSVAEVTDASSLEATLENVRRLAEGGPDFQLEKNYRRKDGTILQVQSNVAGLRDAAGGYQGLLAVVLDLTERQQHEEASRERQHFLDRITAVTPDVLYVLDITDYHFKWVSQQAANRMGYSAEEILAMGADFLPRVMHPDDLARMPAHFAELAQAADGQTLEIDYRLRHPDGSWRWFGGRKTPFTRDGDGRVLEIMGTSADITDRKRAEEAVARLAAIVESSHDALFGEDLDGIITSWNPGAERIFGYRAEEIVGTSIMRLIPADRQVAEHDLQRQIAAGELGGTFESIRLTKDGREFPASITIAPLKDAAGTVIGTSRVLRDITERARAEEALRQNAALFSTLIAQAPMGTYVVDAQFRLREINAEAMPAFASVQPLIGRDFQEVLEILWGPEVGGQIAGIFRRTLATGERYISPPFTEYRHDLGLEQSYEWQTQRVTLPDGQHGVVCYFHEVTERARATAALRASEERMRLAAEATGVGIWQWNVMTNEIRWDAPMFRMYGIEPTPHGVVHYQDWSGAVLPEDLAENEAILQDTVRRGGQSTREFRIKRRSDGECRWIQAVETVLANREGKAEWVLGSNLDVTERVTTAEALRIADRRKDDFLATLAHELRNPLAPLRNGLHILRLTKDSDSADRTQAMMERQLGQMVRLIDDLLEVSRISSGKVVLRPERMELQSAVHSAIEAARPQMDAARHVLQLEIASEPVWLQADATRISQVVSNLLTNAAKYSPVGSRICVGVHREGNEAVLTVADNGEGIPQNMLAEVFEMFTQIDRTLDRAQGGLGIGLSLVRRLVELHGGTVTAESAGLGAGSTFTVRLPTLADAEPGDRNLAPPDEVMAAAKLRVLVVDDNVDAAASLAELLTMYGHEMRVADSGLSALALVREFKPALVLLDIGMPGMNGYETARRIREEDPSGQVTLAALTGWGAEADRVKATEAGFDFHFTKPVEPGKVNGVLQMVALRQAGVAGDSASSQ